MSTRPTNLAEDLQQNKPFSTVAEEALVSVLRTSALLRRALSHRVEPFGISGAQYNVLRILRGAEPDGLPTLAVRDRLVEEAPGITRLIDKLESAGHVRRDRTGRDRRTVRCHITARGLALLDEADAQVRQIIDLVADALPDETEQRQLVELLARTRGALP